MNIVVGFILCLFISPSVFAAGTDPIRYFLVVDNKKVEFTGQTADSQLDQFAKLKNENCAHVFAKIIDENEAQLTSELTQKLNEYRKKVPKQVPPPSFWVTYRVDVYGQLPRINGHANPNSMVCTLSATTLEFKTKVSAGGGMLSFDRATNRFLPNVQSIYKERGDPKSRHEFLLNGILKGDYPEMMKIIRESEERRSHGAIRHSTPRGEPATGATR